MTLVAFVLGALLPLAAPDSVELDESAAAVLASDSAWRPAQATPGQHVLEKVLQTGATHTVGLGACVPAGLASLVPGLFLYRMDSGNVGGGVIVAGCAAGYSIGAAVAICDVAEHITGARGSWQMTALGTASGLVLAGSLISTGILPPEGMIAAAAVLPPLGGIALFELTKEGYTTRKPVPRELITLLGIATVGAAGIAASQYAAISPPAARTLLVPLMQVRW